MSCLNSKIAMRWLVLPPQGIWFGCSVRAQWPGDSSGRGAAVSEVWSCSHCPFCTPRAGLKCKSDSATTDACSKQGLCFVTARSNISWTSKIKQHEFSPEHPCILVVEGWKMVVGSWEHQRQTLCLPAATRASALSTSLTFPDPSHPAQPCQGLDSTMPLIRHKTALFLSKGSRIKLRQAIFSNRSQGITWEYSHGRFLSKNRERKEMQSHRLLPFLHHILSYSFDAPERFLTLTPPLRLVIRYKMLKPAWKAVRHQAELPLSSAASLPSPHLQQRLNTCPPFLPTSPTFHPWGNSKYSYFIPQSLCHMASTQTH